MMPPNPTFHVNMYKISFDPDTVVKLLKGQLSCPQRANFFSDVMQSSSTEKKKLGLLLVMIMEIQRFVKGLSEIERFVKKSTTLNVYYTQWWCQERAGGG